MGRAGCSKPVWLAQAQCEWNVDSNGRCDNERNIEKSFKNHRTAGSPRGGRGASKEKYRAAHAGLSRSILATRSFSVQEPGGLRSGVSAPSASRHRNGDI